jgi:anti-sigma factor RsiW
MPDCKKLAPYVTPYVDQELAAAERADVDAHLRVCPPCQARVAVEQSVRDLLSTHRDTLRKECAPTALRARCAGFTRDSITSDAEAERKAGGGLTAGRAGAASAHSVGPASRWRPRTRSLALAASVVLVVGTAFLYGITDRSNRIMAAELVADHVKCFGLNRIINTQQEASIVEGALASTFGWQVRLPEWPRDMGLELVGARPCLYGEGRIAHVMYRHNGHPVSVFMLPKTVRSDELVDVLGHQAVIWPSGDRTFVLVSREPREQVQRMASYVHAALR